LGGGSNILFTKDFDGVVFKNEIKGFTITQEDEQLAIVKAGAGEQWHEFVMQCIERGLGGLENLSLIPGNVGASPMQNIGAYGVEIKDVFHSLRAYHLKTGETHTFNREECSFGYRESVFKRELKDQYVILDVSFRLSKSPVLNTSYGAIGSELEKMGITSPTIKDVSQAIINIRSSKLPNPKELGNAGSFFKNPVISINHFENILQEHPDAPSYPVDEKHTKIAAGWLIERAGWKGKRIDNCGVHRLQALVLVNYGGASGQEIFELSQAVIDSVHEMFQITLEREVNIL
jgi:UDP-N-acetylmuramate dehydrogenase